MTSASTSYSQWRCPSSQAAARSALRISGKSGCEGVCCSVLHRCAHGQTLPDRGRDGETMGSVPVYHPVRHDQALVCRVGGLAKYNCLAMESGGKATIQRMARPNGIHITAPWDRRRALACNQRPPRNGDAMVSARFFRGRPLQPTHVQHMKPQIHSSSPQPNRQHSNDTFGNMAVPHMRGY